MLPINIADGHAEGVTAQPETTTKPTPVAEKVDKKGPQTGHSYWTLILVPA